MTLGVARVPSFLPTSHSLFQSQLNCHLFGEAFQSCLPEGVSSLLFSPCTACKPQVKHYSIELLLSLFYDCICLSRLQEHSESKWLPIYFFFLLVSQSGRWLMRYNNLCWGVTNQLRELNTIQLKVGGVRVVRSCFTFTLLLTCWVILGRFLNHSGPLHSYLQSEVADQMPSNDSLVVAYGNLPPKILFCGIFRGSQTKIVNTE